VRSPLQLLLTMQLSKYSCKYPMCTAEGNFGRLVVSPARCSCARMAPPAGCCPACAPLQNCVQAQTHGFRSPLQCPALQQFTRLDLEPPASGPRPLSLTPERCHCFMLCCLCRRFEIGEKIMRYLRSPAAGPRPRPRPGTSAAPLQSTPWAPACERRRISVSSFVSETRDVHAPLPRYISSRSAIHRAGACGQHTQKLVVIWTFTFLVGRDFEITPSRCISSPYSPAIHTRGHP